MGQHGSARLSVHSRQTIAMRVRQQLAQKGDGKLSGLKRRWRARMDVHGGRVEGHPTKRTCTSHRDCVGPCPNRSLGPSARPAEPDSFRSEGALITMHEHRSLVHMTMHEHGSLVHPHLHAHVVR
jgi:hypothetical protein